MTRTVLMLTLLAFSSYGFDAFAAPAGKQPASRPARKPNPALAEIQDDPALPRALLIGDSISIGYTLPVREILKGKANLHRIPANGGATLNGLQMIDKWLGDSHWDVIHFNWGLHDLKFMEDGNRQVPLDQYEKNLRELVDRLRKTGATLIWASTTPVPEVDMTPARKNADVIAYNEAAKRLMGEKGIAIDDLYAIALPKLVELQLPANVHFQPSGYETLAQSVAKSIELALKKDGNPKAR